MHCSSSFSGHCQLPLYQNEANHCFVYLIHTSAAGGLFIQYFRLTKNVLGYILIREQPYLDHHCVGSD